MNNATHCKNKALLYVKLSCAVIILVSFLLQVVEQHVSSRLTVLLQYLLVQLHTKLKIPVTPHFSKFTAHLCYTDNKISMEEKCNQM